MTTERQTFIITKSWWGWFVILCYPFQLNFWGPISCTSNLSNWSADFVLIFSVYFKRVKLLTVFTFHFSLFTKHTLKIWNPFFVYIYFGSKIVLSINTVDFLFIISLLFSSFITLKIRCTISYLFPLEPCFLFSTLKSFFSDKFLNENHWLKLTCLRIIVWK